MQLEFLPPPEIYQDDSPRKDYELIILWTLSRNPTCTWSNFLSPPLSIKQATLSNYLKRLQDKGLIEKIRRAVYQITEIGREYLIKKHQKLKNREDNLRYPPKIIRSNRNYQDIIIWMVFNNESCRWSDFTNDPLRINQSSLSKNLNPLLEEQNIRKTNGEYFITENGKRVYEEMIKSYDLDNQSLLEEKTKLVRDLTDKTVNFFQKYEVENDDLKFRFVNLKLLLNYEKVKNLLPNEEDFDKIILFLCINHPDNYPQYFSFERFAQEYNMELKDLELFIWKIVEQNLYTIKFFKITTNSNQIYYFHADERKDIILSAIVDSYVTKFHFLNQLKTASEDNSEPKFFKISDLLNKIMDDIMGFIFHPELKPSIENFLPEYVEYLAYKFEQSTQRGELQNRLGDVYWNEIQSFLDQDRDLTRENPDLEPTTECSNCISMIRSYMYQILDQFFLNPNDFLFNPGIISTWSSGLSSESLTICNDLLTQGNFEDLAEFLQEEDEFQNPSLGKNIILFCISYLTDTNKESLSTLSEIKSMITDENAFLLNFCLSMIDFRNNNFEKALNSIRIALEQANSIENELIKAILEIHEIQILIHNYQKKEVKHKIKALIDDKILQPLIMRISLMFSLTFSHKTISITDSMIELISLQPDTDEMTLLKIVLHGCLSQFNQGIQLIKDSFDSDLEQKNPRTYRTILYLQAVFEYGLMNFSEGDVLSRELENKFPNYSLSYILRGISHANKWINEAKTAPLDAKRFKDYIEYAEEVETSYLRLGAFNIIKAYIYGQKNEFGQAKDAIVKTIQYLPNNIDLRMKQIYYMIENQQKQEALALIDNLIESQENYPVEYVMIKFKCLHWLDREEEAIEYMKQEIEHFPEDVNLKNHLIYVYLGIPDLDKALETALEVSQEAPDQYNILDSLGEVYLVRKEYQKAIKIFLDVIKNDPNGWYIFESHIKLGLCYLHQNKKQKAKECLKKGISVFESLYNYTSKWIEKANATLRKIDKEN